VDKDLHKRIKISATLEGKEINEYLNGVLDNVLVKIGDMK
jgi:predicted HicB family RNase H-like nuclease